MEERRLEDRQEVEDGTQMVEDRVRCQVEDRRRRGGCQEVEDTRQEEDRRKQGCPTERVVGRRRRGCQVV